jgi:hypothetical protein
LSSGRSGWESLEDSDVGLGGSVSIDSNVHGSATVFSEVSVEVLVRVEYRDRVRSEGLEKG